MIENILEHIKNIPLFDDLSDNDIESIAASFNEVSISSGKIIFEAGDKGDCLYIIEKGSVNVYITSSESKEKIVLSTLSKGDYFGEMALITGESRSAAVETVNDTILLKLDKKGFDKLIKNNPSISLSLSHMLSKRLNVANIKRIETEKFYQNKMTPSGDLSKISLVNVLKFCEQNSLSGKLKLENKNKKADFDFDKGQLQSIKMDDLSETDAMDTVLEWEEGKFIIEPSLFNIEESEITDRSISSCELIEKFIRKTLEQLISIVGSEEISNKIAQVIKRLSSFFPIINSCQIKIGADIDITLPCSKTEELNDKQILVIAVLIQSIYESCRHLVVGLNYMDLEQLSGKYSKKLKDISFFEYMRHAEEFTQV